MITLGGGPPDVVTDFVAEELSDPAVRSYLRRRGEYIGDSVSSAIVGRAASYLPGTPRRQPAPPSPWMSKVVTPILDPIQQGATSRIKTRLGPAVVGGVAVLVGVGFILGRWSR